MEDEEAAVMVHQTFQDAYDKCCVWIRTMTDKLALHFEGQKEKEKLQADINEIKVISRIFGDMLASKVILCLCILFIFSSNICAFQISLFI